MRKLSFSNHNKLWIPVCPRIDKGSPFAAITGLFTLCKSRCRGHHTRLWTIVDDCDSWPGVDKKRHGFLFNCTTDKIDCWREVLVMCRGFIGSVNFATAGWPSLSVAGHFPPAVDSLAGNVPLLHSASSFLMVVVVDDEKGAVPQMEGQ